MNEADLTRLKHMLDAARVALKSGHNHTKETLLEDTIQAWGFVKALEIIGEAAINLDASIRNANPQIPWKAIIGMRHKLVHDYYEIDYDVILETITLWLPLLISELEKLLSA